MWALFAYQQEAKLLVQVKHDIDLTEGSRVFEEVVAATWADFNNADLFTKGKDAIALITGLLKGTDLEVKTLLEWARSADDSSDFINKVEMTNFSSDVKRSKLKALKKHLKAANKNNDISNDELWQFLKSFHLLVCDLDIEKGINLALLHSVIGQYQIEKVNAIWTELIDHIQTRVQNAGVISRENIPDNIIDAFKVSISETIPDTFSKPEAKKDISDWNTIEHSAELAIAQLIGSWDEQNTHDCAVVEYISSENYDCWIKKIRKIFSLPNSPLKYKNGIWSFKERLAVWNTLSERIFDDHLDKLQESAIKVLGEVDPQFELNPEDRYAAAIYNKVLQHSHTIRKGLTESLALLGSYPNVLINCSPKKADLVAVLTVRKLLSESNWELWGSTQSVLPLLAEAAPNEFLNVVEQAINPNSPFDKLFADEGNGITGGNYITGLLWALESLAWSSEYLLRVVVLFGELDAHDPGGNWANRPANSLIDIFLPWKPHTTALFEKRKAAIEALIRECPETAWKVLIRLLPNQFGMTTGTHEPEWRQFIPNDWVGNVTNHEYWVQITCYSEFLVNLANENFSRLDSLIQQIEHIPEPVFEKAIKVLENVINNTDSEKIYLLWNKLITVINKHKQYSDAEWALPLEKVGQLEQLAEKLQPKKLEQLYHRLFAQNETNLYEEKGDWENQRNKLEGRRTSAIKEIFELSGYEVVKNFAMTVDAPYKVGQAFGTIIKDKENLVNLKNELGIEDNKVQNFLSGYVWIRYHVDGDNWLSQLGIVNWDKTIISKLLTYLPFNIGIWQVVRKLLNENEGLYWKVINVNPYNIEEKDMYYAIDKLLMYERPLSAIDCLQSLLYEQKKLDIFITVKTLMQAISINEQSRSLDGYHISEIIEHLQNRDDVAEDDLFRIEWAYLPLLEYELGCGALPKTLEKRLATNPDFFCEIIRLSFRSKKIKKENEVISEEQQQIASNAYRLLRNWHIPPGKINESEFNGQYFIEWLNQVVKICDESGHLDIALSKIGNVLIYVPADDSLWINTSVADALNQRDKNELREGYSVGLYNSRGVHTLDPTAKPEKALAKKYKQYAEQVEDKGFQRFSVTLRELAEGYAREAERIMANH